MTHYEILGIRKTATTEEIKSAYKQLVKKYHPDVYPGDKTFAEKKTQEINEAYDVLSDPDKKSEYDALISPHTSTTYTPPDYSGYTYKSTSFYEKTKTSKRNAQAQGSKYSYENYKKTYNSQGNYDYQRRYTDFHRSKTPNSNYSTKSQTGPEFSDGISSFISSFNNASKSSFMTIIVIFFIIFFIVNIFQINSLLKPESTISTSSTSSFNDYSQINDDQESVEEEPSYSTTNPYLEPATSDSTTTSQDSKKEVVPDLEDFDINEIFSDTEIMQAYKEYGSSSFSTFEEFKEALRVTYYQVYVLPLKYAY